MGDLVRIHERPGLAMTTSDTDSSFGLPSDSSTSFLSISPPSAFFNPFFLFFLFFLSLFFLFLSFFFSSFSVIDT